MRNFKTTISFKAAVVVEDERLVSSDEKFRQLISAANKLGFKFEGDTVYISHDKGGVGYGGETVKNASEIK